MRTLEARVCPICHKIYSGYPSISRRDNKTEICPICGSKEAMTDAGFKEGDEIWDKVIEVVETTEHQCGREIQSPDAVSAAGL